MGREKPKDSLVHCGRVITTEELADICETVAICSRLSRTELALTISEHLEWRSATGSLKQDACVKLLDKLEAQGLVTLPEKQISHSVALRRPLFTASPANAVCWGVCCFLARLKACGSVTAGSAGAKMSD
ncbi:MAG: hypothetical protein WC156_02520 [Pedobacter sp.]